MTRREAPFSFMRVGAMLRRHVYTLRGSWPRMVEIMYWPIVQMVTWGFVTTFFLEHSSWVAQAAGVLISAVLLWDVLFRANLGVSLGFMEEMWSRNLGQLFVSPLRPVELVASLTLVSLMRTVVSVTPAAVLAMPLFDVWIFSLGPPLAAFFANILVFGWCIGLIVASLVLRFGLGAESLAWVTIFLVSPLSGIYYPIDTLPGWLQPVSWALPSSHVFEGMRAVMFEGAFDWTLFWRAAGLNAVWLTGASVLFLVMFRLAREKGLLLQQGE